MVKRAGAAPARKRAPRKAAARKASGEPGVRADMVAQVGVAVRRMGAQSVITSRTIADRFDLHTTDLEVLDLIYLRGAVSPGELVTATGLTSGSVTALIDRLVRRGYVERSVDDSDRRKVVVRVRPDAIEPIKRLYAGFEKQMFALWSTYEARELELILDFLSRSTELAVDCCKSIQAEAPASRHARPKAQRTHAPTALPSRARPRARTT